MRPARIKFWLRSRMWRSTWRRCDGCGKRGRRKGSATCGGGRSYPLLYCDIDCRPEGLRASAATWPSWVEVTITADASQAVRAARDAQARIDALTRGRHAR